VFGVLHDRSIKFDLDLNAVINRGFRKGKDYIRKILNDRGLGIGTYF
jgi:hypothetical protein